MTPKSMMTPLVSATLLAAMTTAAVAADMVDAAQPASVGAFFFDRGIASKQVTDSYGDPLIEMRHEGRQYAVFFYGCTDGADCDSLQFYRGYETDGAVDLDVVNTINSEMRYVKASIDSEDDVVMTLDMFTGANGVPAGEFGYLFDLFAETVADFEQTVGWVTE